MTTSMALVGPVTAQPAVPAGPLAPAGGSAGDLARTLAQAAIADSTKAAYARDFRRFEAWCSDADVSALLAEPRTVADYIAQAQADTTDGRPTYSPASISRWLSAINYAHTSRGLLPPGSHPQVLKVMAGIRRTSGPKRPTRRKAPILRDQVAQMLECLPRASWPHSVSATRDRLLLLLGWAGAMRRDELSRLVVGDIEMHPDDGLHVRVWTSKTDQEGESLLKAIPRGQHTLTCAPCAHWRWLAVLAADGVRAETMRAVLTAHGTSHVCGRPLPKVDPAAPLFPPVDKNGNIAPRPMTGHAINAIVKRRLSDAGIDPANFGSHSMRAGFVTQAIRNGATVQQVMRQTGHRTESTVQVYVREHDPLKNNAVTSLGL